MAPVFWQSGRQELKNNMTAVSFIFYMIMIYKLNVNALLVLSETQHDRKMYCFIPQSRHRCTLEIILWSILRFAYGWTATETSVCSFVRHICICVHVCVRNPSHPRAPRTSRYGTRSTFVELWPGNGDGATALCLAFDNRSTRCMHACGTPSKRKKGSSAFLSEKRPLSTSRAARLATLTILCRISRRFCWERILVRDSKFEISSNHIKKTK